MASPVHFTSYQILKLNYHFEPVDAEASIDGKVLNPEMNIRVNPDNENEFAVILESRIVPSTDSEKEKNHSIELEVKLVGYFELEEGLEDEEKALHIEISAPSMLYGVIRTWVSQISAHSGFTPIMLPSVQFAEFGNSTEDLEGDNSTS
ncbi:MAG TPA: protein-export chaperone SecB [Gracilimonas sp.]|uniref:protein-export chaperone SecB n=1 Tax=Gracilimonas sp. TaxID=1974203 RepID=UPI002D873071|nr:protein-export chaperone SecB [Gracilimonas sp.]